MGWCHADPPTTQPRHTKLRNSSYLAAADLVSSGSVVLDQTPQALIGFVAASTVLSQVSVKLAPVEVDDHPPAPSVLLGRKPPHLAILASSATTAG